MRYSLHTAAIMIAACCLLLVNGCGRPPTFEVAGNVMGADGKPVNGAVMKLQFPNGETRQIELVDGKFKTSDVPPGTIKVAFSKLKMPAALPAGYGEEGSASMKSYYDKMDSDKIPKLQMKPYSNNIPEKYLSFELSQLTLEVAAGKENNFELKLSK